ncbi:RelA/SpoT domain-containing protein [Orenia marismortui]|uniref:PpGpp synthetase/RelA/SpoT-type nucleotidyltransferase n=1 Tax=Orenia marismortui TaxID=46469 RepID=A0A4R8HA35_9FIRM|nr:RelA/SpoT domain-containing protein [Orenia marismortui]TDX53153.1 ppGpp synthetase/RelA/SpoT-type nucleotidyltransferase [Orenia marismortui]
MDFKQEDFLKKYHLSKDDISKAQIDWNTLMEIYHDFNTYRTSYETQADFIANTLRRHEKIHSVKSRVKDPDHLIEKIIRKTPNRKEKYGADFQFSIDNYKEEITDLIGVRAIHIFKDDWEEIHNFISKTWKVIEITANVREGDDTKRFEELDIQIQSRKSGYRSVHYLIEFFPTNQKVITEIQVRTIFEEGYGEIDHQLRYSHQEIPEVLALNLLLLNRIVGSSDEMASFINLLNRNWTKMENEYERIIDSKNKQINELKNNIEEKATINSEDKEELIARLNEITINDNIVGLMGNLIKTSNPRNK